LDWERFYLAGQTSVIHGRLRATWATRAKNIFKIQKSWYKIIYNKKVNSDDIMRAKNELTAQKIKYKQNKRIAAEFHHRQ